ncbi:hypothetical protein ACJRO7_020466 [Eucalyptus globulus]|uniref:Uncharacterized protein n=1 Tax=Eucalyptus globulus TaxID=34317 RepID=A0ABD3KLM3_EUCGL
MKVALVVTPRTLENQRRELLIGEPQGIIVENSAKVQGGSSSWSGLRSSSTPGHCGSKGQQVSTSWRGLVSAWHVGDNRFTKGLDVSMGGSGARWSTWSQLTSLVASPRDVSLSTGCVSASK